MNDKIPPPQMTPAPYTPDRQVEPTTGEQEAIATVGYVQRKTGETLSKAKADDRKSETKQTIGVVVIALATIFGAWRVVLSEARAQTDSGIAPIEKRITTLEQNQAAVMTEVRELRLDLREAYKAQRYDRPSPRLEQPPPPVSKDGGL